MRKLALASLLLAQGLACQNKPTDLGPSCDAMADHLLSLLGPIDDNAREVRNAFAARCQADQWPSEVRGCVADTKAGETPKHCRDHLPKAQNDRLEQDLEAIDARARARIPDSCVEYEKLLPTLRSCADFPAADRDALIRALAERKQTWDGMADKTSLDQACRNAIDAVKEAAVNCAPK